MRKYLDIPLTIIVTTVLTVAMLWPMEAPPPAPEGSGALRSLRGARLPLSPHGALRAAAGLRRRECLWRRRRMV